MTLFKPEHLEPWKRPSCYVGAQWAGWYRFLNRSRDSDDLEESNFAIGLAAVRAVMSEESIGGPSTDAPGICGIPGADMATCQVVCENHWAVGWVEWIAIHESDAPALEEADRLVAEIGIYPILDEDDFSRREDQSAQTVWRDNYNLKERLDYIRRQRRQFEFRSFADLLGCVRGRYFAGHASEILH